MSSSSQDKNAGMSTKKGLIGSPIKPFFFATFFIKKSRYGIVFQETPTPTFIVP